MKLKKAGSGRVLKGVRALVVDDSIDTVEMLRHLLRLEGADVTAATSGTAALKLAAGKEFDLILSDISMPEMDGYTLLRQLRNYPELTDVPAIALTGFGQKQDEEESRAAGFCAHLVKPVRLEELVRVSLQAMNRSGNQT